MKSTPKIFILDAKKEIIIKDIPGEEIDRIFNEILTFEEKKRKAINAALRPLFKYNLDFLVISTKC
ncbi:MAG: hypothetical protein IPP49_08395 [Saprospiraceae bacterium]|nr:hypothetical protein [Saprospiraceae bacterium]